MFILALMLLLVASGASASDFWLRGPGACTYSGDGTKYDCAASAGTAGSWVVDRNVNVNSGKWGNTAATVGAGDRLFICGIYDLPLTGSDARDFLKVTSVTFNATNPMILNVACPAGVTNGPSVADPAKVDLKEDYRLRTWTNESGNIWSTPNDGASFYVGYVACNDPDALGVEVDSGNRTGNGAVNPSSFCQYDSRGSSSTKLWVYSVGNPSGYYTKLWASARNFIQISNPIGVQVVGDASVDDDTLAPIWGGVLLQHMNYGVYLGTFSSATTYTAPILVRGLGCKALRTCVEHDGQSGSTYYPRDMVWEDNVFENLAGNGLWVSGKVGAGTVVRYNSGKRSNQSYSAGAYYMAANLDRATHPAESPILVHHNLIDGVGYGRVWPTDGHGVYIEEGMKNVVAYSNVALNLTATGQVGFISNSGRPGNVHRSSVCINCDGLARASDSSNEGNISTLFENMTGVGISGTAIVISGQTGDAPVFRNFQLSATPANSAGKVVAQNVTGVTPTFQSINAVGFNAFDYYNGASSVALPGRTTLAPSFVGGSNLKAPEDLCLLPGSPLINAGTYSGAWVTDFYGRGLGNPPNIGAMGACVGRARANARVIAGSRVAN